MATDLRRLTLREMQIRAFGLEENVEELVDVGHRYSRPSACLMSVLFSARTGFRPGQSDLCDKGGAGNHPSAAFPVFSCLDHTR